MARHWIVVASADHVASGVAGGFVQACHGRKAPFGRMRPGDTVICYSPVKCFGGRETLQAFTALGTVAEAAPYQVETAPGFAPHRRAIVWTRTGTASVRPLLDKLDLTAGRQAWGMALRAGLVEIGGRDAMLIGIAMRLADAHATPARTARAA